jgi:hypothetical protein
MMAEVVEAATMMPRVLVVGRAEIGVVASLLCDLVLTIR